MCKYLIFCFILFIISPSIVIAQLDTLNSTNKVEEKIYNNKSHYGNSFLKLDQTIQSMEDVNLDSSIINKYNRYYKVPFELKNCIFFNPLQMISEHNINLILKKKYSQHGYYSDPKYSVINSLRYYIDTTDITIEKNQDRMNLDSTYLFPYNKYLEPFYFRKYEVTNKEYREFESWVFDSISRQLLYDKEVEGYGSVKKNGSIHLNWKTKIDWNDTIIYAILYDSLYLHGLEKYFSRKEINSKLLNYEYYNSDSLITINIKPDTTCWIKGPYHLEIYKHSYHWHPHYENYPVVGVTFHQTIAFLDWKTKMLQKEMDRKKINVKIRVELPTEAQWDMASTAEIVDGEMKLFTANYYYTSDNNWLTDLFIKPKKSAIWTDSISNNDTVFVFENYSYLANMLNHNNLYKSNESYVNNRINSYEYITEPAIITNKSAYNNIALQDKDELGICFLGGNVSEWLKETYQENWKPIFDLRQQMLEPLSDDNFEIRITTEIEKYYDLNNDSNGQLVKGANWYDERISTKLGKNTAGTNTKVFVDPNSSYATIGFRYVIFVEPK